MEPKYARTKFKITSKRPKCVSVRIPAFVQENLLHLVNKLKSLQLLFGLSHLALAVRGSRAQQRSALFRRYGKSYIQLKEANLKNTKFYTSQPLVSMG